jgi:CheY-like chemotaxis protein
MSDKPTILVVEDDDDSRKLLNTMLTSLGYNVLSFAGGAAALEGIKGQKLNLAMLDIMMPEMNGYEVLEKLKQMPDFVELPIIMVTAKDQDSEILEGYQFGADYYITKPYSLKQIDYGVKLFINNS